MLDVARVCQKLAKAQRPGPGHSTLIPAAHEHWKWPALSGPAPASFLLTQAEAEDTM